MKYFGKCSVWLLLAAIMLASCARKTYSAIENTVERDTTQQHIIDSLLVRLRTIDLQLKMPQVQLSVETSDSVSVLEDSLYISTASYVNGKLHHTLATKPGAKLNASVQVADTTRTHKENNYAVRERERNKVVSEQPKKENFWQRFQRRAGNVLICAVIVIVGVFTVRIIYITKRKKRANEPAEEDSPH